MTKNTDRNKRRRHVRKAQLAERFGGKCTKCGYDRTPSALEFHHQDERRKNFNISGTNLTKRRWPELVAEAGKCVLLCANCHREVHDEYGWILEDGKRARRAEGLVVPPRVSVQSSSRLPSLEPQDEWERRLLAAAVDCGVSLPNSALSSDELYD
jgi:hypothetical protein